MIKKCVGVNIEFNVFVSIIKEWTVIFFLTNKLKIDETYYEISTNGWSFG